MTVEFAIKAVSAGLILYATWLVFRELFAATRGLLDGEGK